MGNLWTILMMTRLNNCLNYIKLLRIPLKGMEVHKASTETVCGRMCLLTELKKNPTLHVWNMSCVIYQNMNWQWLKTTDISTVLNRIYYIQVLTRLWSFLYTGQSVTNVVMNGYKNPGRWWRVFVTVLNKWKNSLFYILYAD